MRGFSLFAGWCAGAPAELCQDGTLHKKFPRNLCNLPPTIFPKTLDTPNKICYTIYVRWGNEQRLTVVCVIPLTLLPRGNTQAGNCCTELGHIYPHLAKSRGGGSLDRFSWTHPRRRKKIQHFFPNPLTNYILYAIICIVNEREE